MKLKKFNYNKKFPLESGVSLPSIEIAYHTYGNYNANKSKVVWVCHALTANSDVFDWWSGLFGEGNLFNSDDYFIICANILGSCYGTTGPLSINPKTNEPYYHNFPEITIRDMVRAHEILRKHLNIDNIYLLTGSSIGGYQALEWAIEKPDLFDNFAFIASNAKQSAWAVAFNQSQRKAIEVDKTWLEKNKKAGTEGLKTARSIALLSYRNYHTYVHSQSETDNKKVSNFKACSYQDYQGEKLAKRFNAFSYYKLLNAMDTHNVARGRESIEKALNKIKANTLVVSVTSDLLFPVDELKFVSEHIHNSYYTEIDSLFGHDGFLIETQKLENEFRKFLNPLSEYFIENDVIYC